jgi:hypothetical protein
MNRTMMRTAIQMGSFQETERIHFGAAANISALQERHHDLANALRRCIAWLDLALPVGLRGIGFCPLGIGRDRCHL